MDGFEFSLCDLWSADDCPCGEVDVVMGVVGVELGHGFLMFLHVE